MKVEFIQEANYKIVKRIYKTKSFKAPYIKYVVSQRVVGGVWKDLIETLTIEEAREYIKMHKEIAPFVEYYS